ncbi:MAG: DEAD/DEAH box helicase, partial [Sphingobacteriales bacterium]
MAKSFEEFKLNRQILNAVADAGYTVATPIQEKAIAPVLSGQDIFGIAETGTGKTAAFVLPILMQLKYAKGENPRALILSPTRELAMQIAEQVKLFSTYTDLRSLVIFGGIGPKTQKEQIAKGVDILIATPGRFLDLYLDGD